MKITTKTDLPAVPSSKALKPSADSDLFQKPSSFKPPRRKTRNSPSFIGGGVRLRRDGASTGKRSRPETPQLRWKFDEIKKDVAVKVPPEDARRGGRKVREVTVSARKLAAGLWRLQGPEVPAGEGESRFQSKSDRLGFQCGVGHTDRVGSEVKDLMQQSPRLLSGSRNEFLHKFSNSAMEGATKWDPVGAKTSEGAPFICRQPKPLEEQIGALSVISTLKVELEQAQTRIHELETERHSSKKKLEHFLRKLSEERATWRSREHEKIRVIIDDVKAELNRERKNRQRMEIVNSKLVNELADTKLMAKRYKQEYEKERKTRELIEEVCDELAKELGETKAEIEAMKRESMTFREEVEEERKMLQMAEVWREERVQMKLVDAKVALEERYCHMNKLITEMETFLSSRGAVPDTVEFLRQASAAVNIQEIREFTYDPPKSDDILSILEDMNFGENSERGEIEPCHASKIHTVSPEGNNINHSDIDIDVDVDVEEDGSGWETMSHAEDQGSNYSPEGSQISINKIRCEEEAIMASKLQLKKVSAISRLWRSGPNNVEGGMKGRLSNGRLSNGAMVSSPDRGSGKGGLSPSDLVGGLPGGSPDLGNPHINRGMKGCIEWPRGMQKSSLKAKLLEARMETQKIQLRHVLKQKS